jgi:hypothetical protein
MNAPAIGTNQGQAQGESKTRAKKNGPKGPFWEQLNYA